MFDDRLENEIDLQPYPLIFVTVSGAHLYGFPSPDSDYDLRGLHKLPVEEVIGLREGRETIETTVVRDGLEIDLVTHDLKKYFQMVLKRNGYVLEQIYSPLVMRTSPAHDRLKEIARDCITRRHSHHYLGMASNQWKLFEKENPRRVKPLLYVFRVLLTGIHLMRSGRVEANLLTLNKEFKLPYIDDLVARKLAGPEKGTLPPDDYPFFEKEFLRLRARLETTAEKTRLPETPPIQARENLNDLLVQLRLGKFS